MFVHRERSAVWRRDASPVPVDPVHQPMVTSCSACVQSQSRILKSSLMKTNKLEDVSTQLTFHICILNFTCQSAPHLKGKVNGGVSNLINIWQRSAIVLSSVLTEL